MRTSGSTNECSELERRRHGGGPQGERSASNPGPPANLYLRTFQEAESPFLWP